MTNGVNKVTLLGCLGSDPNVHSSDKATVVTLSLATTDRYKDKNGQWVKQTQWHHITLFKRLAEIARDYLKKGARVYIEGKLQTQQYKDKAGKDHTKLAIIANELQMLTKGNLDPLAAPLNQFQTTPQEEFDDQIPF